MIIENVSERTQPGRNAADHFTRASFIGIQFSDIPIVFVDVTRDATSVLMANPSFMRMAKLKHAEILGASIASALGQIADTAATEHLTKRLIHDLPGTWTVTCRRADGSTFDISILMHPLRERVGLVRRYILSFYIVAEHMERAGSATDETNTLYRDAPGFIATSQGPDHLITFANESYHQFVGYDNLVGLTVAEAMPDIAAQGFIEILDRVYETGVPFRGYAIKLDFVEKATGATVRRYSNFVYAPIRDAHSNITGIFCEGYDVTSQIEAEAALETLKTQMMHTTRVNAMGTMATTIAHELNQPLSAILNYADGSLRLIAKNQASIETLKSALASIQMAANRAGAIIRTLRDLTDRKVRAIEPFELKPVVEESINLVRTACSLETKIDARIPFGLNINADRIQIQQVIINLVRNGCDAVLEMDEQRVIISAEETPDEITVSVRDTGGGITAESAQDIFTWSDTTKESGMGLGLSISRTIVEAHGGRIWLEDSTNDGAEFRFSIPSAHHPIAKKGLDDTIPVKP